MAELLREEGWRTNWKPKILVKGGTPGKTYTDLMWDVPLSIWNTIRDLEIGFK